jgi:hypothetical protein
LANGQPVEPISFRRDDYWRGYADELNAVLRRIQLLEKKSYATSEATNTCDSWADDSAEEANTDLLRVP